MKIYTKTGDSGKTSLIGGQRVAKSHPRLEAYGSLDELNACIGIALAFLNDGQRGKDQVWNCLISTQHQLFNLGSQLACEDESMRSKLPPVNKKLIDEMEANIDLMNEELPALKEFILPGGSKLAAQLHLSRTVCRRAERKLIQLNDAQNLSSETLEVMFLNRLSDFLFVLARYANLCAGVSDVSWKKDS